jgi:hypothetical protein
MQHVGAALLLSGLGRPAAKVALGFVLAILLALAFAISSLAALLGAPLGRGGNLRSALADSRGRRKGRIGLRAQHGDQLGGRDRLRPIPAEQLGSLWRRR